MHTFHLRFKDGVGAEEQARVVREIAAFQGVVPGLLETSVGLNFSERSQGFGLGAAMRFVDRAALEDYAGSERHMAFVGRVMALLETAQDVDWEM